MNLKCGIYGIFICFLSHFSIEARTSQEIQKVLIALCKKFQSKKPLKFDPKVSTIGLMEYSNNRLFINQKILEEESLSEIYSYLLHEFRHHMQDECKLFKRRTGLSKIDNFYYDQVLKKAQKNEKRTLWFPDDGPEIEQGVYKPKNQDEKKYIKQFKKMIETYSSKALFKPYEFDAELFRIYNLKCPICYDLVLAARLKIYTNKNGYVGRIFMSRYRKDKQTNPCCNAHALSDDPDHNKKVKRLLRSLYKPKDNLGNYLKGIHAADEACGQLSDRHTK
jgi:hypothetical protein